MQIYFEQDYIVIYHDGVNHVAVSEWKIPPSSQEFRIGMDILLEALIHFNIGKVVFDTRCLGVLLNADQEWVSLDWYGRALKAGYSQVAFILYTDVLTNMFVEETVSRTTNRIPTAYFDNMTAAMLWLNQF